MGDSGFKNQVASEYPLQRREGQRRAGESQAL